MLLDVCGVCVCAWGCTGGRRRALTLHAGAQLMHASTVSATETYEKRSMRDSQDIAGEGHVRAQARPRVYRQRAMQPASVLTLLPGGAAPTIFEMFLVGSLTAQVRHGLAYLFENVRCGRDGTRVALAASLTTHAFRAWCRCYLR